MAKARLDTKGEETAFPFSYLWANFPGHRVSRSPLPTPFGDRRPCVWRETVERATINGTNQPFARNTKPTNSPGLTTPKSEYWRTAALFFFLLSKRSCRIRWIHNASGSSWDAWWVRSWDKGKWKESCDRFNENHPTREMPITIAKTITR